MECASCNYTELLKLFAAQRCAAQVFYLEKKTRGDLGLFVKSNVLTVHYNELGEQKVKHKVIS